MRSSVLQTQDPLQREILRLEWAARLLWGGGGVPGPGPRRQEVTCLGNVFHWPRVCTGSCRGSGLEGGAGHRADRTWPFFS